ncbi:MAG TPA: hypothetical protein PKZ97_12575 [Azospirillaceae bacterium]|nr:hypothetical protein [Azospirillaceae bacterium]HRQ81942.1 hypothetical protein [Azospirillaceae bacterium]
MSKLDLITALSSVEEALKRSPRAADCRRLAARLAVVRSGLLMTDLPDHAGDPAAAMAALVEAAHLAGADNRQLADAFNAAVERHPR